MKKKRGFYFLEAGLLLVLYVKKLSPLGWLN